MKNLGLTCTSIFYLLISPIIYMSTNSLGVSIAFILILFGALFSLYLLRLDLINDINKIKYNKKTLLLFIVVLTLALAFTYISNFLFLPNDYTSQNQQVLNSALFSHNTIIKSLSFLDAILVAPIMESIIFQYGLQRTLFIKIDAFSKSKTFSILLASSLTFFVFFLFHSPNLSLNDLIYYSFLYFFCLFYGLSNNNLLLTIILHMIWNLI